MNKLLSRLIGMDKELKEKLFSCLGFFVTMFLLRRMEDSCVFAVRQYFRSKPSDVLICLILLAIVFYLAINSHLFHLIKCFRESNEKRKIIYRFSACLIIVLVLFACFVRFTYLSTQNSVESETDLINPLENESPSAEESYLNQTRNFEDQSLFNSSNGTLHANTCPIIQFEIQFCPASISSLIETNSWKFDDRNEFFGKEGLLLNTTELVDEPFINTSNLNTINWEDSLKTYDKSIIKIALLMIIGFLVWNLYWALGKGLHGQQKETSKHLTLL